MAALDLSAFATGNTKTETAKTDFVKSQFWLNFGAMCDDEFITLPLGLGLDTMKPGVWSANSSPEFIATVQSRNAFLEKVLSVAKQLAPGESAFILEAEGSPFAVQLLHAKAPAKPDPAKVKSFDWEITLKKG